MGFDGIRWVSEGEQRTRLPCPLLRNAFSGLSPVMLHSMLYHIKSSVVP